jgi:hypothetical protein
MCGMMGIILYEGTRLPDYRFEILAVALLL